MRSHASESSSHSKDSKVDPSNTNYDYSSSSSHAYSLPYAHQNTSIVRASSLDKYSNEEQMNQIINQFNAGTGESYVTRNNFFGTAVLPDHFRLVQYNNKPQLVGPSSQRVFLFNPYPWIASAQMGTYPQTALHIGLNGHHYLNVPQGKYLKIWRGTTPELLGPGPHVILTQNFRLDKPDQSAEDSVALVDISDDYIQLGNYHRLRVPAGKIAKIWVGTSSYILESQSEPYEFNDPLFRVEFTLNNNVKKYFEDTASEYIQHGNFHRLRIPAGKLATVWDGNKAMILESRPEPYVYVNNNLFRLAKKMIRHGNNPPTYENFHDATEQLIVHGSIKRVIAPTGEVAICYDNGVLDTRSGSFYVDSPNYLVDGFLNCKTTTLVLPNDSHNKNKKEDTYVFRTSDSLEIGVKILAIYHIEDPKLTLSKLSKGDIAPHIENKVIAEMGRVIGNSSSADFQKTCNITVVPNEKETKRDLLDFNDKFKAPAEEHLRMTLAEYGIRLESLNLETPKILDPLTASKMAEYSLENAAARARIISLPQQREIAVQSATRDANQAAIHIKQQNENTISQAESAKSALLIAAEAQRDAARIRAESDAAALIIVAEAELEAAKLKAEATKLTQGVKLELLGQEGTVYGNNQNLTDIKRSETMSGAFNKGTMMISPEVAASLLTTGFFTPVRGVQPSSGVVVPIAPRAPGQTGSQTT